MIARAICKGRAAARLPFLVFVAAAGTLVAPSGLAFADEKPVVIVAAPLSGARGSISVSMLAARAAEGAAITRFRVAYVDDRCSADGARALAESIATRHARILAVVGHPCTSAAAAAARLYEAAGITFIPTTPFVREAASRSAAPAPAPRLLVLVDGSLSEGTFLGRSAATVATSAAIRLAVVSDATAAMRTIARDAAEAARAAGMAPGLIETIPASARDLDAIARRVAATRATHVVLAAYPAEAWLLIDALARAGSRPAILAASALSSEPPPPSAGELGSRVRIVQQPTYDAGPVMAGDAAATRARALTSIALTLVAQAQDASDLAAALRGTTSHVHGRAIRFDAEGRSDLPPWEFVTWNGTGWRP